MFHSQARSVHEQTAAFYGAAVWTYHFGQETSEIRTINVAISSHPPLCQGWREPPAPLADPVQQLLHSRFLCSWIPPLLLLTAASPDTSGPTRTCPPARMFPALLQIIHSGTLFCLASLASVFISHRGNWAHLGSTSAFVENEIK